MDGTTAQLHRVFVLPDDKLDGFRSSRSAKPSGNGQDLGRTPTERELLQEGVEAGIDQHQIELFQFGLRMEEFIEENPIGRHLVQQANQELGEATSKIFGADSLVSEDARDAHLQGKAALMVLGWMQDSIERGVTAENQMRDEE